MMDTECVKKISGKGERTTKMPEQINSTVFDTLSKEAACYADETNDYLLYDVAGKTVEKYIEYFAGSEKERDSIYSCLLKSFFVSVSQTRHNLFSIKEDSFFKPDAGKADLEIFSSFCEKVIAKLSTLTEEQPLEADILTDLKILVEENCL